MLDDQLAAYGLGARSVTSNSKDAVGASHHRLAMPGNSALPCDCLAEGATLGRTQPNGGSSDQRLGSEAVAYAWGEISAYARLRGRPRPQNDTWVAAACLVHEFPLATLNVKDFSDFAEHEGLTIITD